MIGASCVSHDTGKGARYNEVGGPKDGTSNIFNTKLQDGCEAGGVQSESICDASGGFLPCQELKEARLPGTNQNIFVATHHVQDGASSFVIWAQVHASGTGVSVLLPRPCVRG